jgi:hypothetical protein
MVRVSVSALPLLFAAALAASSGDPPSIADKPPRRSAGPTQMHEVVARPRVPDSVAHLVTPPLDDVAIASILSWNLSGGRPARIGVVRNLPVSEDSTFAVGPDKAVLLDAPGSDYVRVGVRCIADSNVWITGSDGEVESFLCRPAETSWSPVVAGPVALVQFDLATSSVVAVAQILRPSLAMQRGSLDNSSCLLDVSCVSPDPYVGFRDDRAAIALIIFMKDGNVAACSGGLITDRNDTLTPYFLTANHCISTSEAASSVVAVWDYATPFCGGPEPSLSSLPRAVGALLMTTSASSDVTLLKLSSVPGGRTFLGWSVNGGMTTSGATLYRVSYAQAGIQRFTATVIDTSFGGCSSRQQPEFLFSRPLTGSTAEGSSGAPVMAAGGYVVGQLLGQCVPIGGDNCSFGSVTTDGALSASYPLLQPFIDPVVCQPPSISSQPQSQTIQAGQTASISIVAAGTAPLSYQWYAGASGDLSRPYAGVTGSAITWSPPTTASTWVRVSNSCGSTDSVTVTVTVLPPCTTPAITEQPRNQTIQSGQVATIQVLAQA